MYVIEEEVWSILSMGFFLREPASCSGGHFTVCEELGRWPSVFNGCRETLGHTINKSLKLVRVVVKMIRLSGLEQSVTCD
jgi:hypothetical protein